MIDAIKKFMNRNNEYYVNMQKICEIRLEQLKEVSKLEPKISKPMRVWDEFSEGWEDIEIGEMYFDTIEGDLFIKYDSTSSMRV